MPRSGHFWYCNACGAQNSIVDGECQYCECEGLSCPRDNCSAPEHFHADHVEEPEPTCPLCVVAGAGAAVAVGADADLQIAPVAVHSIGCVCASCSVVRVSDERGW